MVEDTDPSWMMVSQALGLSTYYVSPFWIFLDPFPPLSNFCLFEQLVLCPAIRLFNLSGPDKLLV